MKRHINILFCIFTLCLSACNNQADHRTNVEPTFDCNSLVDKKVILEIAKSIIDKHDNEHIWNLSEIDTAEFFMTEDFFVSTTAKSRLVLIGGSTGLSSGTADNLLILFSCSDSLDIIWSGQVGDFSLDDIIDLNGDGIKEIVINANMMWMGECNDNYNIFNFKDDKQNFLFKSHSTSFIDCGRDNLGELFKKGDTLEQKFDCSVLQTIDKEYYVQQIQTIKIHNGGQADDEIIKNLKIIIDTTNIKLK